MDGAKTGSSLPPSVGIELLGYGPGGSDLASDDLGPSHERSRPNQAGTLAAVVGLLGLAFVGLVLLGSTGTDDSFDQQEATPSSIEPPQDPDGQTSDDETDEVVDGLDPEGLFRQEQLEYLSRLSSVDTDIVEGLVIAWVRDDDQLELRSLETGVALPVATLAQHDVPPLPEHIQLIGGENATWLIDLLEPARSGKLSNSVRMVRLGSELDSYGFISENEEAPTDFFVGSLWGPAMNGTAQAPKSWTILPVPGAGIVVSSPTAESSVVRGGGFEALPRSVGRAIAASPDHIAGVACDNRLECVGSVSRWDGSEQQIIDANALSNDAIVRISPDGRLLLSVQGTRWSLFDLEGNSSHFWTERLAVDDTITWTPDSRALVWVAEGTLVSLDVTGIGRDVDGLPAARIVSPIGAIGARLANSDVAVFDVDLVLESSETVDSVG